LNTPDEFVVVEVSTAPFWTTVTVAPLRYTPVEYTDPVILAVPVRGLATIRVAEAEWLRPVESVPVISMA
jgi:hypothetical protein